MSGIYVKSLGHYIVACDFCGETEKSISQYCDGPALCGGCEAQYLAPTRRGFLDLPDNDNPEFRAMHREAWADYSDVQAHRDRVAGIV